jgi:hypothetical protein
MVVVFSKICCDNRYGTYAVIILIKTQTTSEIKYIVVVAGLKSNLASLNVSFAKT